MNEDGFVLLTRTQHGVRQTMKDMCRRSDPATFEIVKNSLYKIAEEMRVVLAKTAYSPTFEVGRRLFLRRLRRTRRDGGARSRSAHSPRLDARRGPRRRRRVRIRRARRRCFCSQRSLFRGQPLAGRQCGAARISTAANCSATRVCERIGRISALPRPAATAQ